MITNKGQVIRIPVNNIRVTNRNTKGVILMRVDEDEKIVAVAKVVEDTDIEESSTEGDSDGSDKEESAVSESNLDVADQEESSVTKSDSDVGGQEEGSPTEES